MKKKTKSPNTLTNHTSSLSRRLCWETKPLSTHTHTKKIHWPLLYHTYTRPPLYALGNVTSHYLMHKMVAWFYSRLSMYHQLSSHRTLLDNAVILMHSQGAIIPKLTWSNCTRSHSLNSPYDLHPDWWPPHVAGNLPQERGKTHAFSVSSSSWPQTGIEESALVARIHSCNQAQYCVHFTCLIWSC